MLRYALPRRLNPVSRSFGMDRGRPIDRHYIDAFIARHRSDIRGRALEAGGFVCYARDLGDDRVSQIDILYPRPGFPDGTVVGDLNSGEGIESDAFDCLIMTQVFGSIYDLPACAAHCHRALRPGGVLLATVSGLAHVAPYTSKNWGDYWRFTDTSVRRLFGDAFGEANATVETFGNVLAACGFLMGMASRDLTAKELAHHDPQYQLTIAVRAVKAG